MFVFLTASRNCIRKIKFIEHFQKHKLQTNSLPCSGKYLSHEGENTHFTSLGVWPPQSDREITPLLVLATLNRGSDAVWIEIDHRIHRREFYYEFNHLPCITSDYL